ncbi:HD-GYP domain-containing protein [Faecalispora anaeroviscerum]|uniref:HD-GYP domain-containing protein n=1 Tax=Faecalispora anaeroviscerum TaxID=2991836 RepID=UPI0024BB26C9|nr:HD domain-containing phosphohydrolase [Faecalispora anaeroviscerum]
MKLNVNQMLLSFSFTLDFVERDLLKDVTNHTRHVAYICARIAKLRNLPEQDFFDLISYALLHDNGIARSLLDRAPVDMAGLERNIRHCELGEENVSYFPFNHPIPGVILYHHECYDGSGFFGKRGEEIPFYSRLIALANRVAVEYAQGNAPSNIMDVLRKDAHLFDPELLQLFYRVSQHGEFWLNMQPMFIEPVLERLLPQQTREFSYRNIRRISRLYSNIIDAKSPFTGGHSRGISKKVGILCRYYGRNEEEYWKMRIAADLHDLGKIMVPNEILDKPGSLTREEIDVIQSHTYYTRKALEMVQGFEDITEWAANHHEKLNGKGYPYGLTAEQLDFNSRLMTCVDIYQALTEDRPYRMALTHADAVGILDTMSRQNLIDASIVNDIDMVLGTVFYEEDLKIQKAH